MSLGMTYHDVGDDIWTVTGVISAAWCIRYLPSQTGRGKS